MEAHSLQFYNCCCSWSFSFIRGYCRRNHGLRTVIKNQTVDPLTGNQGPVFSTGQNTPIVINTTNIETTITQSVEKVGPAVVTVVGTVPAQISFFGNTGDQMVSGSGVFISQQGYVLTNNHVVEGTKDVNIILSDGTQEKATVVGTDRYSDIAVLKWKAMYLQSRRLAILML